jgi:two-component system nitrogen regulation response regulator GlnG
VRKYRLLLIDDDPTLRKALTEAFSLEGYEVKGASTLQEGRLFFQSDPFDLLLLDIRLPDGDGLDFLKEWMGRSSAPAIVFTAYDRMEHVIRAMQMGAFDYVEKPFDPKDLFVKVQIALKKGRGEKISLSEGEESPSLVGKSPPMREIWKTIGKVSSSDMTVLITGESGTGKELVAKTIHTFSHRSGGPFVAVNMAAIPHDLLEAELFGYEKGAFTGATQSYPGKFRQADKGTIFLDEIGDLPLPMQGKLLRVLEERVVTPLGSRISYPVDVRILSASQVPLEDAVQKGTFRADLYYRFNVLRIHMPPLRERKEDIPLLVHHFLKEMVEKGEIPPKGFTPKALNYLMEYSWPGNVRELQNVVRRVALLSPYRELDLDVVKEYGIPAVETGSLPQKEEKALSEILREKIPPLMVSMYKGSMRDAWREIVSVVEEVVLRSALGITRGNQVKTAEFLGINRNTLRVKLREYGISYREYRKKKE